MTHVRIGGVPEHFNLPWRLAIEEGAFDDVGLTAEWIDFPGGTGAIMKALEAGEVDLATPLTEGAITAIANGAPARLIAIWVNSPLIWGVHAAGASDAQAIPDLEGQRFAISRYGSGSELMSRVLAEDLGWTLSDDSWVVVGGLDGALEQLPAGEAEIFLWNKSMTQPHVTDGTLKRVGEFATPWPSFAVAARTGFLDDHPGVAETISEIARARAAALETDPGMAQLVVERYELEYDSAMDWASQIDWTPAAASIDLALVADIAARMHRLGRIDRPLDDPSTLLAD